MIEVTNPQPIQLPWRIGRGTTGDVMFASTKGLAEEGNHDPKVSGARTSETGKRLER